MARLQRPEKFEAKHQRLRLGNGSAQFLGFVTELTSSSDSKEEGLLVKESLSAPDEDNETNVEVLLVKQPSGARVYLSLPFLFRLSEFLRLVERGP
jgi:uncharacterized protein (UPF0548 family)